MGRYKRFKAKIRSRGKQQRKLGGGMQKTDRKVHRHGLHYKADTHRIDTLRSMNGVKGVNMGLAIQSTIQPLVTPDKPYKHLCDYK